MSCSIRAWITGLRPICRGTSIRYSRGRHRVIQASVGGRLPAWDPGDYFLLLLPDPPLRARTQGQIVQTKLAATPVTLTYPLAADLVPTELAAPAAAATGQTMPVSWRVDNIGDGETLGHGSWHVRGWNDQLYFSHDAQLDAGDLLAAEVPNALGLDQGGSYTRHQPASAAGPDTWLVLPLGQDGRRSAALRIQHRQQRARFQTPRSTSSALNPTWRWFPSRFRHRRSPDNRWPSIGP